MLINKRNQNYSYFHQDIDKKNYQQFSQKIFSLTEVERPCLENRAILGSWI